MSANSQILVTSINKSINTAKVTGQLDMSILSLFSMYKYYIDFTQELVDNGNSSFKSVNRCLKENAVNLKYKYPDTICLYKTIIKYFPNGSTGNNNPILGDILIDIEGNNSYTFTQNDFNDEFIDSNSDSIKRVRVEGIGALSGTLTYNGLTLSANVYEIPFNNISLLKYIREDNTLFSEDLIVRVTDTGVPSLYSNEATLTIIGASTSENLPPEIGDQTIYADNRVNTVLTLAMFTSDLTPPYNDPENDLIDAIRIDEVSTANTGQFLYNGTPIVVGQIITREDLASGLLVHQGPNQDAISSDVFNFSVRDEGSQIWVE